MKYLSRIIIFLNLILFFPSMVNAIFIDKRLGVGFIIGEPTGISIKKWINNSTAWDAAIAWSLIDKEKIAVQADFLRHNFNEIKSDLGEMPMYFGLGGAIKIVEEDDGQEAVFGIRGVFGIEYIFETEPAEVFFEVGPIIQIIPKLDIGVTGGIGIRYYF